MVYKPYDDIEEYQFDDDEDVIYDDAEETSSSSEANKKAPSKKGLLKIIIPILIVLVVLYIIYKLFVWMLSPSKPKADVQKPAAATKVVPIEQQVLAKQTLAPIATVRPAISSSEIKNLENATDHSLKNLSQQIMLLQQENSQLQGQLQSQQSAMQAQILALSSKLDNMQEHVSGVNNAIEGVSAQITANQETQSKLQAYKDKYEKLANKKIRERKLYFVEAVIPGRAWLQNSDGSTITVAVGDQIPGYGKIVTINPYSGTVTTDLGIKIHYGVTN